MLWDLFCRVIDNHGDIGVCWRLAAGLAEAGHTVRLRVDDASALAWLAPRGAPGVTVLGFDDSAPPGDAVVEAFGCDPPEPFLAALRAATDARGGQPAWINLEYLTAEAFAERNHGLASPVLAGPARGLTKYFFYPGFTPATGGLIREPDLGWQQQAFDRAAWLAGQGVSPGGRVASLFCYEPAALPELLSGLARGEPTDLLVTAGRAASAVRAAEAALPSGWNAAGRLRITWLPLLPQPGFDRLLWACDVNFVRGEDSLVRALWAGRPFVWQLYPQDDGAHRAKLEAFLAWLQPPPRLAQAFRAWNGMGGTLPPLDIPGWTGTAVAARDRLLAQPDLVSQLIGFVGARFPAGLK